MTPPVVEAIEEVRASCSPSSIDVEEDGQGGAYVVVHDLALGEQFHPARGWVGFHVTFQYPHADVYPHYVDAQITRVDGQPMGAAITPTSWRGRPCHQISRRSNHWNPAGDTAAGKLLKVLDWLRAQ